MKALKHAATKKFRQTISVSLVIAASAGAVPPSLGSEAAGQDPDKAVASIRAAAARGDAEAMYRLAMLHIEGKLPNADYDLGVQLLMDSAAKGNEDADRMSAFMASAFSGEGC